MYFCVFCVGPFVSPEEVVARLIQVGLFDKAIDTALCFEIPVDSIFEALSSRYVLSVYVKVFSVINPLLLKKSPKCLYLLIGLRDGAGFTKLACAIFCHTKHVMYMDFVISVDSISMVINAALSSGAYT